MYSSKKLKEYGAVPYATVVSEKSGLNDPNISWVEAHVINRSTDSSYFYTSTSQSSRVIYRDVAFAILFLIHIGIIAVAGVRSGSFHGMTIELSQEDQNDQFPIFNIVVNLIVPAVFFSFIVSYFITGIVIPKYPQVAVRMCLITSVMINVLFMFLLCVALQTWWIYIFAIANAFYSVWYIRAIDTWVPFSASILSLASKGITDNWGLYVLSLVLSALGLFWMIGWTYVANGMGLFGDLSQYYGYHNDVNPTSMSWTTVFMIVSLYWTIVVLMNIGQSTVAGSIATWCFNKVKGQGCCSATVTSSLYRSCTTSFGSICLGSLLNAIMITLRVLLNWAQQRARENDENGSALLYCIIKCIVDCLGDMLEYFNQWAYTFVGIYGLSYVESGRSVLELFQSRGFTAILSSNLSAYVLSIISLMSAMSSGIISILFTAKSDLDPVLGFWFSFVIGLTISSIMMNTVSAAAKSVIVCYADHPARLHDCHPTETKELSLVIPTVCSAARTYVFTEHATVI
jgi:hypothetical protein